MQKGTRFSGHRHVNSIKIKFRKKPSNIPWLYGYSNRASFSIYAFPESERHELYLKLLRNERLAKNK